MPSSPCKRTSRPSSNGRNRTEKWALILVLRMLRLLVQDLPLTKELKDTIDSEVGDMQLVLRGDKTMEEFVQDYPEYETGSQVRYHVRYKEGSPDGGD